MLRKKIYTIIFESHTIGGKLFDLLLIVCILMSVLAVSLHSVQEINERWDESLTVAEWMFTILFTIEYLTRIYCSPNPRRYIFSFFGFVDLISILPTYISFLVSETQYFIVIRILRVLRIFRILKFVQYIGETNILLEAFKRSRHKIIVFLFSVISMTVIFGSLMYAIEVEENSGFTSIPISIYWAIVTMTTVGYGDISPITPLGQFLAAIIMIVGYSIIAVPGGIVTANIIAQRDSRNAIKCPHCHSHGHELDALYCKGCGLRLDS